MADRITCSCGGNNPRCFKCDGRGWIDRVIEEPSLKLPPVRKELIMVEGGGYSAGWLGSLRPLTQKNRTPKVEQVPVDEAERATQKKTRQNNEHVKCPDCGQSVFAKNLDKHRAKVHLPTVAGKAEAQRLVAKVTRQLEKRSLICDVCGLQVDRATLDRHRLDAHGIQIPSKQSKKKSKDKPTGAVAARQRTLRALSDELVEMRKRLKRASPDEVHVGLKLRISELEQTLKKSKRPKKKTWSPFLSGSFESAKR